MAKGDTVNAEEEIVRALYSPYWDGERATARAFMELEVSVSRSAVLPYEEIVKIFKHDLDGSGPDGARRVSATAAISVGQVIDLCLCNPATGVSVTEDPTEATDKFMANPAHAVVCGFDAAEPNNRRELSRGQANKIRQHCTYRMVG